MPIKRQSANQRPLNPMTDIAIRVENLSKRYPSIKLRHSGQRRIGREEEVPDTMAGALLNFLNQPSHNATCTASPNPPALEWRYAIISIKVLEEYDGNSHC